MSQSSKKQTFLHGAALLAIATAIVKVIGALYKLPLKMVIGDEGYSYFSTAYDIYTVLLLISTAGLPVAMSRMISQASSLGDQTQIRKVYNSARALFFGIGAVSTLLMMLFCRQLAEALEQPDAWFAIVCRGPCAFLMGIISTYRGFFQGQGNMIPTSVSQVLEALFKLVVGLLAAIILLHFSGSIPLAAGGAILGVTVSCLVSVFYLFAVYRKATADTVSREGGIAPSGQTVKQLLAIAVPITIGAAGLQLLTVVETSLYMDRLIGLLESNRLLSPLAELLESEVIAANPAGLTATEKYAKVAANFNGIYNMGKTIYNMPNAFITPITISIIPAITSQLTLGNNNGVKATEESAARVTALLSLPCAVGLMVLAEPIMALLGGYSGEKLVLDTQLMQLLGISVFLHAIVLVTNAVMQAHGHANIPVVNMLCSGVLNLVVVYLLSGNPAIGILGAPLGTALCNLCIAILNLFAIRKCIPQKPAVLRNLLRPVIPVLIMGAVAYGVWQGIALVPGITSRVILCGIPIAAAGVAYVVCAALFKAITREDCMLLPKGEKIAKLLRL